ncbi:MAG: CAP domain-containing protein [Psychrobacter sp.]|nr:CAP domain-containing protein [Psychrobacter sp.]
MSAKAFSQSSNKPLIVLILLLLLPAYDGADRTYLKAIYIKDVDTLMVKMIAKMANFQSADGLDSAKSLPDNNADSRADNTAFEDTIADDNIATSHLDNSNYYNKNAVSIANNEINLARTSCGLSALSAGSELESMAIRHANYINYVFANSTPTLFNAHSQSQIDDIAKVTGRNNPYFTGDELKERLQRANYKNIAYGVAENIAQSSYYHSLGDMVAPDNAARSMVKSLLAAPYHLRALMIPNSSVTGTGVVAFKPYDKDANTYQSYALVNYAAATKTSKDVSYSGIFTYPCQDVTETVTALYNETPDPFRGTRNLQDNPIGQPIYINVPTAKTIKISNISFYDVARDREVPTQLLDVDQDPYRNTSYELPANEAFILPLTDRLKSCEHRPKVGQNCGLYGNSQYRVSFDVMIDNKALVNKTFTFTTGEVSY